LPRLAVVEFTINTNTDKVKTDAITVRNLVEAQMISSGRFQMITRGDIDKLLENQRIQVSSISSAENIRKLQLQNISYIVTGSVDAMGNDYAITVRVLDVSSGQFSHSDNDFMGSGSRDLYNGITGLMTKFVAGMSATGGKVTSSRTYKVGDFGPAGGYVFFDKGVFSGGWRYLEAAPVDLEFFAKWGVPDYDLPNLNIVLGSGKQNTQMIIKTMEQLRESKSAAQLCAKINYDGFNDWFLPNMTELDLMYKNLHKKGLGNFGNYSYWSSQQYSVEYGQSKDFTSGDDNFYPKGIEDMRAIRPIRAF